MQTTTQTTSEAQEAILSKLKNIKSTYDGNLQTMLDSTALGLFSALNDSDILYINKNINKKLHQIKSKLEHSFTNCDANNNLTDFNIIKKRKVEYEALCEKSNSFNLDNPKINLKKNIVQQTSSQNLNLNNIFLKNKNKTNNTNNTEISYQLCSDVGDVIDFQTADSLTTNKQKTKQKFFEIEMPSLENKDKKIKTKVYGLSIKNNIIDYKNIYFDPTDGIDFGEPIKLSINAGYQNIKMEGDTINIFCNKSLEINILQNPNLLSAEDVKKCLNNDNIKSKIEKFLEPNNFLSESKPLLSDVIYDKLSKIDSLNDAQRQVITEFLVEDILIVATFIEGCKDGDKSFMQHLQNIGEQYSDINSYQAYITNFIDTEFNNFLQNTFTDTFDNNGNIKSMIFCEGIKADDLISYCIQNIDTIQKKALGSQIYLLNSENNIAPDNIIIGLNASNVIIEDLVLEAQNGKSKRWFETTFGFERRIRNKINKKILSGKININDSLDKKKNIATQRAKLEIDFLEDLGIPNADFVKYDLTTDKYENAQNNIKKMVKKFIEGDGDIKETVNNILECLNASTNHITDNLSGNNIEFILNKKRSEKTIIDLILNNNIKNNIDHIKNMIKTHYLSFGQYPAFLLKIKKHADIENALASTDSSFMDLLTTIAKYENSLSLLQDTITGSFDVTYINNVHKANHIDRFLNNTLLNKLEKIVGNNKLISISTSVLLTTLMGAMIAPATLLGMASISIFPSILSFLQKRGIHKEKVDSIQRKYNSIKDEGDRKQFISDITDKKIVGYENVIKEQINIVRHDIDSLSKSIFDLAQKKILTVEDLGHLKTHLQTAITLKYVQHKYGVSTLAGINEEDYLKFMQNINFGLSKFKHSVRSISDVNKQSLLGNLDQDVDQISYKFFLQEDLFNYSDKDEPNYIDTTSYTKKLTINRSNKLGIQDGLITMGTFSTLGWLMGLASTGVSTIPDINISPLTSTTKEAARVITPIDYIVKPGKWLAENLSKLGRGILVGTKTTGSFILPAIPLSIENVKYFGRFTNKLLQVGKTQIKALFKK